MLHIFNYKCISALFVIDLFALIIQFEYFASLLVIKELESIFIMLFSMFEYY